MSLLESGSVSDPGCSRRERSRVAMSLSGVTLQLKAVWCERAMKTND